jgi:arylsulfatase A-like enzyme
VRRILAAVVALAALLPASAAARPNIVVIQMDDLPLHASWALREAGALIGDRGVRFDKYYANFSLCCPSRATLLTGRYAHNHGVQSNFPPEGGYHALDSKKTLPVWLKRAGYTTGHIGKYLNDYFLTDGVPPGWDEWFTTVDPTTYRYDGYLVNDNGLPRLFGTSQADYQPDVMTRHAVEVLGQMATAGKPFFLALDYLPPHGEPLADVPVATRDNPPRPAVRHQGLFASEPLPRTPAFNEADVSDKPAHVRSRPLLSDAQISDVQEWYRRQLESVQSADEGIAQVIATLERTGVLHNTYVFFLSDNGWMAGNHRYPSGKLRVYDASQHLPLYVRGPGIPAGAHTRALAGNVDIAPTLLALSGATADLDVDGRSLLPVLDDPGRSWWRDIEHEYKPGLLNSLVATLQGGGSDPAYQAIRTDDDWLYVEHGTGETELYDLRADPFEVNSRHADLRYTGVRLALAARLAWLRSCAGASCRAAGGPPIPRP